MVEKLKKTSTTPVVKASKVAPTKMLVSVKKCAGNCESEYQDSVYGKGMRVMNPTGTKIGTCSYRCTVCRTKN